MHSRASRGNPSPRLPCRSLAYGRFAPMASRCSSQARKPAPQRGAGGLAAAPRSAFAPRVPRVARRSPPPHSFLSPARFALLALALLLASRACAPWPARAPSPLAPRKPSAPACPRSLPAGGSRLVASLPALAGAHLSPPQVPDKPLGGFIITTTSQKSKAELYGLRPALPFALVVIPNVCGH